MKRSTIKILVIQLFLFLFLVCDYLIFKNFKFKDFLLSFILLCGLFINILLLGYSKNKYFNVKELTISVLIFTLLYKAIIFIILGWKLGFAKSLYHIGFNHFFYMVLPNFLIIIISELLRNQMVSKGKMSKLVLVTTTILFILIDLLINLNRFSINNFAGLFELTAFVLLPSVIKNTFLVYAIYHFGYVPTIIYRIITELLVYYLPITPNLGVYLQSILDIILPFIFLLYFYNYVEKIKNKKEDKKLINVKKQFVKKISLIAFSVVLTVFIILISGLFRFYFLVIGSGSMMPAINVGDMVLVEKLDNYQNLKIGDVLVYSKKDKVIVHRIVAIDFENNNYTFTTKGDYNETIDNWIISEKEVIGIARFKISYIGYPTVWLNQLFLGGK